MSNQERAEQIINKLLPLWQECLMGHHKQKDCLFWIKRNYTAYAPEDTDWTFEHWGYIYDDTCVETKTFYEAQMAMVKWFQEHIKMYCLSELKDLEQGPEHGDAPVEHWESVLKRLGEINEELTEVNRLKV